MTLNRVSVDPKPVVCHGIRMEADLSGSLNYGSPMDVAVASYQRMIDDLLDFGDLKVWSVLVTIFGDLAHRSGDFLPGPFLTAITTELGIKPEAQRVALHRLRKDGWIEVEKDGRVSHYALSALARRETEAVQARVFDARTPRLEPIYLVLVNPDVGYEAPRNWVPLGPATFLTDQTPEPETALLVTETQVKDLPDWARQRAIPEEISAAYLALAQHLEVDLSLDTIPARKRMALRILILHRWRRLVLSHSPTAANMMRPDWSGNLCRDRVQRWLTDLPRGDRTDLEAS